MRRELAHVAAVTSLSILCLVAGAATGGAQQRTRSSGLPSMIVYPEQRIALRMDHSIPAHRALPCVRCHAGADRSEHAANLLIPAEASCLPCHADRITREAPQADRCGFCHVGYGQGAPGLVPASLFPAPRLHFSHAAHVRRGMRCLDCHRGIDQTTLGTRAQLPTMRQCFQCHAGAAASAPTECTTCHLALPDGRMRSTFPEGSMNPPRWLHGMHHDRDWIVRHRWVGADNGPLCATCHTERDCTSCHDGRVRPPRVHPNDWLTLHPVMARRNTPRCTGCHTLQTFCSECHARLGLSPISAPLVHTRGRFHPPANVWVRGPVLHAREARRSMSDCASCHTERDCVQCHGALGVGAGISPHPPGFRAQCGRLLRQNDRACRTCHGDVSGLAALCP